MRWKIGECPDANGNWTLREADGTEHGDTETCIATVYGGILEQELIETAPRLKEECDRLQEQVAALQNERDVLKSLLADNLTAWDGEEDSVKEEHAALIEETRAALEATKEEA